MQTDFKYRIGLKTSPWLPHRRAHRGLFRLSLLISVLLGVAFLFKWLWQEEDLSSVQAENSQNLGEKGETYSVIPLKLPPRVDVPVQALPNGPAFMSLPTSKNESFLSATERLREPSSPRKESVTIAPGQNLSLIFPKLGLSAGMLQEILQVTKARSVFAKLKPGQNLEFFWDKNGNFEAMRIPVTDETSLKIRYENNHPVIENQKRVVTKAVQYRAGTIHSSLYWAGHKAGLSDKLILQLSEIFAWDIDFALDIQPEDSFQVLYETLYSEEGKKIRDGDILVAEFTNQGRPYRALRYTSSVGASSYYTPGGESLQKAFIRTPVAFSVISSQFNLSRRHPILDIIRAHKGVDYAAPSGTPVKATGDGKVVFMGRKGGYGNTIILDHGQQYKTVYAHLLKFGRSLSTGKRVSQNDLIGFVGKSGLATGPHLHYEFQVNGIHKNPVTVQLPRAKSILKAEKPLFLERTRTLLAQMESYKQGYAKLTPSEVKRQ
ncbi:MAG: M23 family metallopeptidase [Gammaproteobacteria bacterium]|nr:M23 family metallopeptidase [Gammaproteobacteria bacterium]